MKRFALVLLVACGSKDAPPPAPPGQSVHDAMALICSIPTLDVSAIADVTIRQSEINKWFKANVKNPDAIKTYLSIATVPPAERRKYIHDAARAVDIDRCALAAFYDPSPKSVPLP